MREKEIIKKLKYDIASRKETYQKELEQISQEENLLRYIKGMLEITAESMASFPYYDGSEEETKDARNMFNEMLKYTLKEDNIIQEFKSEIKNLYFLEKIGYQHAIQYQETLKKIDSFRTKIEQAYLAITHSQDLDDLKYKKQQIILDLNQLVMILEDENQEVENIDELYKKIQYTSLPEADKTEILLLILKRNTILQSHKVKLLKEILAHQEKNNKTNNNYLLLSEEAVSLLQDTSKLDEIIKKHHLKITITTNRLLAEKKELDQLRQEVKEQCQQALAKYFIISKQSRKIIQIIKGQYQSAKKEV